MPAGSKPGERRGGRAKGTKNKSTIAQEAFRKEAIEGNDPLMFFADVLKDKDETFERRFAAARELAPYLHPKLSSTDVNAKVSTHEKELGLLERVAAQNGAANGKAQ